MLSFLDCAAILGVVVCLFGAWSLTCLLLNIAHARSTALPYVVLPCALLGAPWLLCQPVALPILEAFPTRWTKGWLPLLLFSEGWHHGYQPFEDIGADTFLAVSPGGIILYTCDADVSTQLFRDGSFGKPAGLMKILNVFGPTMTGTDGPEARLYRRITAPFFNEATLRNVFRQSVQGGKELLLVLAQTTVDDKLRTLTARLSLNLLNRVSLEHQSQSELGKALRFEDQVPLGHTMSYSQAMHALLDNFQTVYVAPRWFLRTYVSVANFHRG